MQETIVNYWEALDMVQPGIAQGTIYGIAQGIQLGKEEGRLEGCLESLRPVMVLLVKTRFPALAVIANQQAICIKDPELLKSLVGNLIMAKTEGDAMRLLTVAIPKSTNELITNE